MLFWHCRHLSVRSIGAEVMTERDDDSGQREDEAIWHDAVLDALKPFGYVNFRKGNALVKATGTIVGTFTTKLTVIGNSGMGWIRSLP